MEDTFFDRLASLCGPELSKAISTGNADGVGEIIEGLATILGRSIGRALGRDPAAVDRMLTGCEHRIASEATFTAELQRFAEAVKLRGRP